MPVVQQGSINTTALIVPDVYVQIVPPQVALLNGVPTNIAALVGTASWGPVNSPVVFGDMAGYARAFGGINNRKYDLGTAVAAAVLNGANNFRGIRVTDGDDVAATVAVTISSTVQITFTSRYTGSLANSDQVTISAGTQADTSKVVVARPGQVPEVYDNIGGSANARWVNIANAINNGQGALRGASQLIVAEAGSGTAAPAAATYTLASGADGATVADSDLVGVDTTPRTGMYQIRGTGASVAALVDVTDPSTLAAQLAFGLNEGVYMIATGPSGQTISEAITAKGTTDSYAIKYVLGDYPYFNDTVNGVVRPISPQGYVVGRLVNLSPEQSGLNKPIQGVVATQTSSAHLVYSSAELQQMIGAGIDVITTPSPGGNYFSLRAGHNTSSNPLTNGDNYTRLTNYIAYTLANGLGPFVGQLQTTTERSAAQAAIQFFLGAMEDQGMIGDPNGGPAYSVQINAANNPTDRVALGYQQADVRVKYLAVVEKFLVNLEGSAATVIHQAA